MKVRGAIFLNLFLAGLLSVPLFGQTQQTPAATRTAQQSAAAHPAQSATATPIDPAKAASIQQLLKLTGGVDMVNKVMDGMQANIKTGIANLLPPGQYREQLIDLFFQKFRAEADTQHLVDIAAQAYDKYMTKDDIDGLIQFYSTPLGKKVLAVLPQLTVEVQSESMKWGQTVGHQAMTEVLAEHPELAKAMVDAQKASRPQ